MANKVSRRCPYCNAKITFDLDSTDSAMECPRCGEPVARKKFPLAEGHSVPPNIKLENAKSLRSIAVSLQVASIIHIDECSKDAEAKISMLEAIDNSLVESFE